jgi:hypothetical protein
MQELISNIQTSYEAYISIGKILLLLTGIVGLIMVKSNQRIRIVVIFVLIGSVIALNPFLIHQKILLLGENNQYRMGMILIVPVLSAYVITVIYKKLTDKKQKVIALIGIILLIAASGKFLYTSDNFYEFNNNDKVYDLAVELADCVTTTNPTPTVAISEVQGVFIRQYNTDIKLVCAPEITENWQEPEDDNVRMMRTLLAVRVPDMQELTELTRAMECDYLILTKYQIEADSPVNYGFKNIATFEKFTVFENTLGEE